jgi:hypothetical protein
MMIKDRYSFQEPVFSLAMFTTLKRSIEFGILKQEVPLEEESGRMLRRGIQSG